MQFILSRTKQVEVESLGLVNTHRLAELGVEFKGGGLLVDARGELVHGHTVCAVDDDFAYEKDPELLPLSGKPVSKEDLIAFGVPAKAADDSTKAASVVESLGKMNESAFSVAKYGQS